MAINRMSQIKVFPNIKSLSQAALEEFIALANDSIRRRDRFSVSLAGGSTPQTLYQRLAYPDYQAQVDWNKVHFFWGDERHVPPGHPDSNFRMVHESLIRKIPIPGSNVNRVPAEMEVKEAALRYEVVLRDFFYGYWPQFDLVLLGMGSDGHTASLFPHSEGLKEESRWFIANFAPKSEEWRLTLSKNAINAARNIIIIVSGEEKAGTLAKVLEGEHRPDEMPIQLVSPNKGILIWMIDENAASKLHQGGSYKP